MAMQQLPVPPPPTAKKGKFTRHGRVKRETEGDKRARSPKSPQKILLSASMEIPISSGVVLTQGDGYNPLAWDNMPTALQKQFPHWKASSPTTKRCHEETKEQCPVGEHPFLISQKCQILPAHGIPYVVMESDTLNSISLKFDTTPAELARLNKRTLAGFSIFPGNVVYVPDGEEDVGSPTSMLAVQRETPRKSAPPFLNYSSPTPEREAPPTQSPSTNQIKTSKKKLQLTKSQELFPKNSLDVQPGRKRTASYSARLGKGADDGLSDWSYQDEETDTFVSLSSKYITDDQGCVHGTLTVSTTSLLFKPNQSDPLVLEHGSEPYELLFPLDDITHASITRDVAPPHRQSFSSPRRQSSLSLRTQKSNDVIVMEMPRSATSTENSSTVATTENEQIDKSGGESVLITESKTESESQNGLVKDGACGMERSPAPTMSDTDAESERESENIATPIMQLSLTEITADLEVEGGGEGEREGEEEREGEGEKEGEGEGEKEGEGEGEVEEEKLDLESRQSGSGKEHESFASLPNEDDDITGCNNPSNKNDQDELPGSADELLEIMGSEEPRPRPHAVSQCSVLSLDAVLGDTAYFLHFRVASISGQKYTYVPVNSSRGIDIPRGSGEKSSSPPVQCVKTCFCFVIPERNLEKVVSFLSLHHPQGSSRLGSPSDQQRWTDGHFDVINKGSHTDKEDLSFCDDHFTNPDSSWEVYSLSDIHKYRNVICHMDVEDSLPLPHMTAESVLISKNHLRKLIIHFPSQAIGHDMHLVYSTFTHGISLRTMYRNMLAFGDTPVLFIVRDDSNKLFGALASSYLRLSDHFYGTGESCLFMFSEEEELEAFPWTGLNSYFIKGNTDSIAIGSGDGHFGLWLDEDFLHGSSYNCETYGNRPLATTEDFLCTGVEAWGFRDQH